LSHLARVDLVVSDINRRANLGYGITYSGTVAAEMEGLVAQDYVSVTPLVVDMAAHELLDELRDSELDLRQRGPETDKQSSDDGGL
jgi:broad specificity polyphosphatase/5'/3'-nucleotidase SurE